MKDCLRQVFWRTLLNHLPILVCIAAGWWQGAIICFGITTVVMAYGILSPSTRLFGPVTAHLDRPGVLLTLDDGPDPETTLVALDLLDRFDAKAVFFLIGDRVDRWPDLAREIVRRGHEVGNHSQTHPAGSFWALGPWRMWREIASCQETLHRVLGVRPQWFRAPVGHHNAFTHPVIQHIGLRLMAWNCRGFDGTDRNVERVLGRIRAGLRPGAIVLLHEAVPSSAAVLEGTLRLLEERKIKVLSMADAGL